MPRSPLSSAGVRPVRVLPARALAIAACLVVWLLGLAPAHGAPSPADNAPLRRFALLVGANDGGSERARLRYANSDADALAEVLRDLGGVGAGDLVHLRDPTPDEIDAAFDDLERKLQAAANAGERTQLLFYYSGHSDERGLLLAGERVEYARLRKRVQAVPADVRIAILDSCASGAFTRSKGGTKRPPFLVGSATDVEGHAFLTSSSADEAAQESDRVGGSFFTHFLNSGLRGAADIDGDRFVTLTEAYRYAFEATLARTESTRGGPQHAAYDIQLAGSGDLVMTDLRKPSAVLVLGTDLAGRISVRASSGRLAAEVDKPKGSGLLALAIEPGKYQILVDDGTTPRRASVEVGRGGRVAVVAADLRAVPVEYATLRGGAVTGGMLEVPFDIGIVPPASLNGRAARRAKDPEARIRNRVSLSFGWSRAATIEGMGLALGATIVDERMRGVQASLGASIARGELEGLQFSSTFARARRVVGVQSAMINHADTVDRGTQLGLVNATRGLRGAQIGLVNVAKDVRGVQLGLFNWADRADAAVGLLSITREGGVHPEVWTSDTAAFNLGLRFPARYTYSMLAIGVHPFGNGANWQFGIGFGGHVPLGAKGAFMDIDLGTYLVLDGMTNPKKAAMNQLRLLFGWQAFRRLSMFAGPTLSVLTNEENTPPDALDEMSGAVAGDDEPRVHRPGYGWTVYEHRGNVSRIRVWPGFAAGFRF